MLKERSIIMMNSFFQLSVLTTVFLVIYSKGAVGIRCYSCTSDHFRPDPDCEMGRISRMSSIECQGMKFCSVSRMENYTPAPVVHVALAAGIVNNAAPPVTGLTVTRNCWSNDNPVGLPGKWQFCQDDLCNAGSRSSLSILSSALFSMLMTSMINLLLSK